MRNRASAGETGVTFCIPDGRLGALGEASPPPLAAFFGFAFAFAATALEDFAAGTASEAAAAAAGLAGDRRAPQPLKTLEAVDDENDMAKSLVGLLLGFKRRGGHGLFVGLWNAREMGSDCKDCREREERRKRRRRRRRRGPLMVFWTRSDGGDRT